MSIPSVSSEPRVFYSGRASGVNLIGRLLRAALVVGASLAVFHLSYATHRAEAVAAIRSAELQNQDAQHLLDRARQHLTHVETLEFTATVEERIRLGSAGVAGLGMLWLLISWLRWTSVRYVITNDRIQFEKGILSRTVKSIELWRVRDLIFHRSALEALFGMGRIMIVARDATAQTSVVGPIGTARSVYNQLISAREAAMRDRGVVAVES